MKGFYKMVKAVIVCTAFVLIKGCAVNVEKPPLTSSKLVKINAKLAIAACGQGNVIKVNTEGYECNK